MCCVPPYRRTDIAEPVCVQLFVRAGGKASEPHAFYYTPAPRAQAPPPHCTVHPHAVKYSGMIRLIVTRQTCYVMSWRVLRTTCDTSLYYIMTFNYGYIFDDSVNYIDGSFFLCFNFFLKISICINSLQWIEFNR